MIIDALAFLLGALGAFGVAWIYITSLHRVKKPPLYNAETPSWPPTEDNYGIDVKFSEEPAEEAPLGDPDSLEHLHPGVIVRHVNTWDSYIVTANFGDRVTAARTQDITNARYWRVVNANGMETKNECE